MRKRIRIELKPEEMPKQWYNVKADLPFKLDPPLDPETNEPISGEKLARIFPLGVLEQEVSTDRFISIPEEVLDEYVVFRPTPLIRATKLEEILETPAKIYYKYEGVSPTGSHKTNTALAQAYLNAREGVKTLVTETGAGQWGSALAYAASKFGMTVKAFMVRASYESKPMRKYMITLFGGDVVASPSEETASGRKFLQDNGNYSGSLGIAISEAIDRVLESNSTKYSLGSVLDHVLLHQTIIGLEIRKQLELADEKASIVIGCHGGGSNFGGTVLPFVVERLEEEKVRLIAAEPTACPTLTRGEYRYDSGDSAGFTPLLKMYTLGREFIPPSIHAGGLRYHGASPLVSRLLSEGIIEAQAFEQEEIMKAGRLFASVEGIIPAPESSHAIAATIREAEDARQKNTKETIVFTLSGHGLLDLAAYG
ncbi:MAG TPA: TrpB-like pyridoxal phosphate-dependent enzyme [Kosmotogaceae bacterium]|nr:MAG: Tryptophan synthase beta chain [Thermotogales bacterium 46_20]HAA84878.1 TrpB-like pyridoxal phosphate-dependent enzyme [Kosmotogaceae bacterium]